jgi:hypothetical protein
MQKAIEYVRQEQVLGVPELDGGSGPPLGGDGDRERDPRPDPATVVPLDGRVTRHRTSGLSQEDDLGYEETARLESLIERHSLGGSVLDMARMLRELNVDLSNLPRP